MARPRVRASLRVFALIALSATIMLCNHQSGRPSPITPAHAIQVDLAKTKLPLSPWEQARATINLARSKLPKLPRSSPYEREWAKYRQRDGLLSLDYVKSLARTSAAKKKSGSSDVFKVVFVRLWLIPPFSPFASSHPHPPVFRHAHAPCSRGKSLHQPQHRERHHGLAGLWVTLPLPWLTPLFFSSFQCSDTPTPPAQEGNLFTNPSMENGTMGWQGFGYAPIKAVVNATAPTPYSYLVAYNRSYTYAGPKQSVRDVAAAVYELAIWVKLDAGDRQYHKVQPYSYLVAHNRSYTYAGPKQSVKDVPAAAYELAIWVKLDAGSTSLHRLRSTTSEFVPGAAAQLTVFESTQKQSTTSEFGTGAAAQVTVGDTHKVQFFSYLVAYNRSYTYLGLERMAAAANELAVWVRVDVWYLCIGGANARSTCWTKLTGGFTLHEPAAEVAVYVQGAAVGSEIWVTSASLLKVDMGMWRSRQNENIKKYRMRPVRLSIQGLGLGLVPARVQIDQVSSDFPFGANVNGAILYDTAYQEIDQVSSDFLFGTNVNGTILHDTAYQEGHSFPTPFHPSPSLSVVLESIQLGSVQQRGQVSLLFSSWVVLQSPGSLPSLQWFLNRFNWAVFNNEGKWYFNERREGAEDYIVTDALVEWFTPFNPLSTPLYPLPPASTPVQPLLSLVHSFQPPFHPFPPPSNPVHFLPPQWFLNRFNWAVFNNEGKWYFNERREGVEDYNVTDALVDWFTQRNVSVRGHNIFWAVEKFVQTWVKNLNDTALWAAMQRRMNSAVTRYTGKVQHWDVINEPLHGNYYGQRLGEDIHSWMFKAARAIDPNVRLFLNDYNTVEQCDRGANPEIYLEKVWNLNATGAPVTGIGVEAHYSGEPQLVRLKHDLNRLAVAGMPIWLTELDFTQVQSEQQRADYLEAVMREAFAHPSVAGIVLWSAGRSTCTYYKDMDPGMCNPCDACLANDKFVDNLAGQRYVRLRKEWSTHLVKQVTFGSPIKFRGFHGKYRARITVNGKLIERYFYVPKQTVGLNVDIKI
ncbi:unnamed protein product [Closterium sp. Yama58-4]|nr:unnamed protein product [Closterium sp. Yama58-4]